MKLLKKAAFAIVFAGIYGATFTSVAQKDTNATTLEAQAPFKVNNVYFQEWYAGIKVGGTGINIFLPITDIAENVEINHIYFRNLKGELNLKDDRYFSQLKNTSPHYTFKKSEAPADYPFALKDNESVISYIENGITKYYKIAVITEVAGTYYKNGPPSIYVNDNTTDLASLDDELDEE